MKVKTKLKNGVTKVKLLAKHPMESGFIKGKPAHYIETLTVYHKDEKIFNANLGPAISRNPYLSFELTGMDKGDSLDFEWKDNKGDSKKTTAKVK